MTPLPPPLCDYIINLLPLSLITVDEVLGSFIRLYVFIFMSDQAEGFRALKASEMDGFRALKPSNLATGTVKIVLLVARSVAVLSKLSLN